MKHFALLNIAMAALGRFPSPPVRHGFSSFPTAGYAEHGKMVSNQPAHAAKNAEMPPLIKKGAGPHTLLLFFT
ncbi:MAG: hypothetical protein LBU47_06360 [Christensenellaceae bacterium]|nr:hypothetical protein [Christensenellaceae bacterium]